jgi:predicted phage terminase large subunit-like protein
MTSSLFVPPDCFTIGTPAEHSNARQSQFATAGDDPSAFVTYCFTDPTGIPLVQSAFHRDLQCFLSQSRLALVELPRDHGKSTQICARVLWELGKNPALRVKIVCSSEAIAIERGRFLLRAIDSNRNVRRVFPNLRPAEPWTAARFTVERQSNIMGPSVTAIGVGSAVTGTRADLLVCDDIVDVKSMASRPERERVKAYFCDNLMNLLEPHGRCWALFTPWHADDLNGELKRNKSFGHYRKAIENDFAPVWPERWTREHLKERRKEIGATSFARGYRLIPLAEEDLPIRPEWIRFWIAENPIERTILSIDPAVSVKEKADASAVVVLGQTATNQIRCLEAIARRVNAPDLFRLIEDADRRWNPDVILFEANAAFKGINDLLVRFAGYGPKIKAITQVKDKFARVQPFSVSVENGSFLLKGSPDGGVDPAQQALFDEMRTFPVGEHDDLIDAAVTGVKYLLENREPRVWTM